MYIIDKEKSLTNKFFCISLANVLRRYVYPSINVYIAKNSGLVHLTSCVDLECLSFQIVDLTNDHVFQGFGNCRHSVCGRIELAQQKGYQYDYILFDLA